MSMRKLQVPGRHMIEDYSRTYQLKKSHSTNKSIELDVYQANLARSSYFEFKSTEEERIPFRQVLLPSSSQAWYEICRHPFTVVIWNIPPSLC